MWMMTKLGFYSVVEYDNKICIRARSEKDMWALCEFFNTQEMPVNTPERDYPWRVTLEWDEWRDCFPKLAELVTYPNFKNEVAFRNPKREKLYHQVWAILRGIEKE